MGGLGKRLIETSLYRFRVPLLALTLGLVAWLILGPNEPIATPESAVAPTLPQARVEPPPPLPVPSPVDHPMLASTSKFQTEESTPEEDLEMVHAVLGNFRRAFHGNPVGENEEIFAALRGKNPKGIRFLPNSFPGLQESGKVVDRWGTPWRFHALSGEEMEVLSAGPDCTFGTQDDLGWEAAR